MKNIRIFILAALLCLGTNAFAQTDTTFWFAVPYTSSHTGDADYHLVAFSYGQAATVTVEMPAASYPYKKVASIAANSSAVIQLVTDIPYNKLDSSDTWQHAQDTLAVPFNTISPRGLRVSSSAPISCYLQISGRNGENYTLKGKNALGTDFIVPMQNVLESKAATKVRYAQCYSSIQVVATEDNTNINITPSATLLSGGSNSITLQKGEAYAWRAAAKTAAGHLGGTIISADQPIVVNTTDDGAALNAGANERADIIGDQIVPTSLAGTEFIAVPKNGETNEFVTLMALEDNTTFSYNGTTTNLASKGDMKTVYITKTTLFTSDKDAAAFQVTNWNGETGGTMLPHLSCTGSNLVRYKATKETDTLYFNIITRKNNIESITLNGTPIAKIEFTAVNNPDGSESEWCYAQIEETNNVKSKIYTVEATNGGLCHLAAIDLFVDSITSTNIRSCCTYGYFSDYSEIHEYSETMETLATSYTWVGHYWGKGEDPANQMVFTTTGIYRDTLESIQGCDSICVLYLTISSQKDSTICWGSSINWNTISTPPLFSDTLLVDTLPNIGGTDSIVYLRVFIREQIAGWYIQNQTLCNFSGKLPVKIDKGTGHVDSVYIVFDDLAILPVATTINESTDSINIYIPTSSTATQIQATVYLVDTLYRCIPGTFSFTIFNDHQNVIYSKWDDVLVVNNHDGMYVAYQWYLNGQKIEGATEQYLYDTINTKIASNQFAAEITDRDGNTFLTCPLSFKDAPASRTLLGSTSAQVSPNPAMRGSRVSIVGVEENATIRIYTTTGVFVREEQGNAFTADMEKGCYMLHIQNGDSRSVQKLIIR